MKKRLFSFFIALFLIASLLVSFFSFNKDEADANAAAFRVTTYEFSMSGTSYDLVLFNDLTSDYFVMVNGGSGGNTTRNPDDTFVRVTQDPFGTGALGTSANSKTLRFERNASVDTWKGSATVVEAVGDTSGASFSLLDVVEITLTGAGVQNSTAGTAAMTDINQVVPFGGIRGGGVEVAAGAGADDHCYGHGKIVVSATNTIQAERNSTGCGAGGESATYTIYVTEWGSLWTIQSVNVTGNAGGAGANIAAEYNTAAITSVVRDETWVWASGYTDDGGIGDSGAGQIATLGNGVAQNANETTVAVGAEYSDNRDFQVYTLSHASSSVDYRFKADGGSTNSSFDHTVDAGPASEFYTSPNIVGVVTLAAMDGGDGGWTTLFGSDPFADSNIDLVVDEDTILDAERAHTTEQADYWMFSTNDSGVILNSGGSVIGEFGTASSVGSATSSVTFGNTLSDPVVIATYGLPSTTDTPAVPRTGNVTNSGFDVRLAIAASSGSPTAGNVYWIAINNGAHTLPGSVSMEAGTTSISTTNEDGDWTSAQMNQITPTNSYTNPRVFAHVQTDNDTDWQVGWQSNGTQTNPATAAAIYVGRHVGGDTDNTRGTETLGHVIIEDSTGTTNGNEWIATRSADFIQGVDNAPPYAEAINFSTPSFTRGRFGLQYNSSNGTGTAFPRPYWGVRHTASTVMKAFREYNGQNWVAWVQSVDLTDVTQSIPNSLPVASSVSVNSAASAVTLTESATTTVNCTGTVTDNNGFADITSVTAFFYRTSQGTTTADDDNFKYTAGGNFGCTQSNGSGNSADYTCPFDVWYFADPTDTGSPYVGEEWTCELHPIDNTATGTPDTDTIEMNSLLALDVTTPIDFGTLDANTDTSATNSTTTISNTGNRDIDPQLSAVAMTSTSTSDTIPASSQEYSATPFTYGSGTDLSGTPTTLDITLPQQTGASTTTDDVSWGLGVPDGVESGTYTGTTTVTATAGI